MTIKSSLAFLAALALVVATITGCDSSSTPDDDHEELSVTMHSTAGNERLGTIEISDGTNGAVFMPQLTGLVEGEHGFHIHANGSCGNGGQDAGGHYDPNNTASHEGPNGNGHIGDLPVLVANSGGDVRVAVTAPRVDAHDIEGLALIIHAGGDNYSDDPNPLGGGGARVACGVIPEHDDDH